MPKGIKGKTPCSVSGCGRHVAGDGYCVMHRHRFRKYGDPGPLESTLPRTKGLTCKIDGCGRSVASLLMCKLHYERQRRHGDPGPPGRIYAPAGSGTISKYHGYRMIRRDGKQVREHRAVMEEQLGRPLESFEEVHHRNGQRADNRPSNLELWLTHQPRGQRVEDLIAFVVHHYPEQTAAALRQLNK
jgi:hypothetical protein